MSPTIKFKPAEGGFSLIEIIVVISIMGLIAVIASGFLLVSMAASQKAQITKEVRQNGNYALSVMEGMVLNSLFVGCSSPNIIRTEDDQREPTVFLCSQGKISSNSANLTNDRILISDCDFSCESPSGRPTKVKIKFTASQSGVGLRASEKASLIFKTEVVTKNF